MPRVRPCHFVTEKYANAAVAPLELSEIFESLPLRIRATARAQPHAQPLGMKPTLNSTSDQKLIQTPGY